MARARYSSSGKGRRHRPTSSKQEIAVFFFFQAEDGIRDVAVTGVQTCALPISEPQPYDNTLKALFGKEADQIIPYLLPGAEFVGNLRDEERNIEINRSTLKADQIGRASCRERV